MTGIKILARRCQQQIGLFNIFPVNPEWSSIFIFLYYTSSDNKFWDDRSIALVRGSHNCVSEKLHTTLALIVKANERLRLDSLVVKRKQQRMELLTSDDNDTICDNQEKISEEDIVVRPKEIVVVLIMFTMLIVSVYR